MGGGGQNLSQLGGTAGNYNYGGNYQSGGTPALGQGASQQSGTDAQRNFINAHGALPPGMGGGALNQGQQNFFQNKGYLPPGFTGGTNYGFMNPGHGQTGGQPPGGGGHPQWQGAGSSGEPPGSYNAQGGGGWDISQAFQHLFGGGQNFGPYTNWMQ
jgi:hypothetical protein